MWFKSGGASAANISYTAFQLHPYFVINKALVPTHPIPTLLSYKADIAASFWHLANPKATPITPKEMHKICNVRSYTCFLYSYDLLASYF